MPVETHSSLMDNVKTLDFFRRLDFHPSLFPAAPANHLFRDLPPANYAGFLSRFCQGLKSSVRLLSNTSLPTLSLPAPPGYLWPKEEGETPLDLSRNKQQQQQQQQQQVSSHHFAPSSLLSSSPLDWSILQ
ncbi:unnamed protein product, partial [Dibothriocephalus latus]